LPPLSWDSAEWLISFSFPWMVWSTIIRLPILQSACLALTPWY
jgi:hypothetical protein